MAEILKKEAMGIKVLRYISIEILRNMKGFLQDIIIKTTPSSPPSQGGEAIIRLTPKKGCG